MTASRTHSIKSHKVYHKHRQPGRENHRTEELCQCNESMKRLTSLHSWGSVAALHSWEFSSCLWKVTEKFQTCICDNDVGTGGSSPYDCTQDETWADTPMNRHKHKILIDMHNVYPKRGQCLTQGKHCRMKYPFRKDEYWGHYACWSENKIKPKKQYPDRRLWSSASLFISPFLSISLLFQHNQWVFNKIQDEIWTRKQTADVRALVNGTKRGKNCSEAGQVFPRNIKIINFAWTIGQNRNWDN